MDSKFHVSTLSCWHVTQQCFEHFKKHLYFNQKTTTTNNNNDNNNNEEKKNLATIVAYSLLELGKNRIVHTFAICVRKF